MKKYNFFHFFIPIMESEFTTNVPDNWESEVVDGYYSWGGYRASEIEDVD